MSLSDSNFKEFSGRLRRIEKAHRKGYGFEAQGTLGRSSTYRREGSLARILRAALLVLAVGWVMKGAIYFYVGHEVYHQRLADLATGTDFDPVAARIMSADPVTKLIASFLGEVFPKI
ncbi:hypothetical protein [Pseudogemmobacter humi]|uniref:Uncharacterized protein n=1 Tax=Pseudogemmobacter humi TaxID=2483812 RepID=A0A3P5X7G8_9RHOB|nr:hypothetical protein [Pseudogemmobacter humi]VDC30355.1 hypothetical protein XINFAN_02537 [Pseudogemmobacter humi]